MSENPVAYLSSDGTLFNSDFPAYAKHMNSMRDEEDGSFIDDEITAEPLYTKEQLQPKVKMTRKQYNQFENYKIGKNNFYHFWQSLLCDKISLVDDVPEHDLMLAWINSATIEIVSEKKWFVRTKKSSGFGKYSYLKKIESKDIVSTFNIKSVAMKFDTKEEAELWTNPLTKAVLLPVECE